VAVDGETIAVKVTLRPFLDGLALEMTVVVVVALFTVCESAGDALAEWFESPPYCAVMEWEPTASVDADNTATPLALRAEVPSVDAPSMNVTVPLAPDNGLTVAVNATTWPNAEGLSDDVNAVVVFTVPGTTVCVTVADVLPV
jgi:hypothetical protein